jgi:hypothetical protein
MQAPSHDHFVRRMLAGFLITVGDGMPVSISFGSAVAVVQNADDTVAAPVTVTT